jgi:molybdate transport system regulatory protein
VPARIQIRSKIWIEVEGQPVFGKGRRSLLEAIERTGSINRAATALRISYRKAWGYITAMEQRLGIKLVERHVGGRHGGGTVLTEDARAFLHRYEQLEKGIDAFVDRRFQQAFGPHPAVRS